MPGKRTQLSRQTATAKRLRLLRSNETADENMHRLATQRVISEQNLTRQSSVERSQRLASQNFRTSANRQRESSAERSQRLASQYSRTLANRQRESSAERSQRLASQNSRTLANRQRESSAVHSQRLASQNSRTLANRQRESSAERSQRLASQNSRTLANRQRESSAVHSQRLASQNSRTLANRQRESSAERSQRLASQNSRTLANRQRESSAERSQRLASQNSRTLANRERESRAERSHRLAQQNARSARNRTRRQHSLLNSAFAYDCTFDYAELNDIDIGRMDKICNLCQAIKWAAEAPGICCSGGKVNIPKIPAPTSVFKELISGSHPSSKHFLNHSRQYNTLFQMTSFGAKEIREGNFMPTFKVQGQVYHLIGNLLPAEGAQPEFLQIYFVSHADQVSLRSNLNPTLQIYLIDALQTYLNDHNMYIQSFKYNLENRPTNDFKLIIHADVKPPNEHRGRYNAPIVDEVAVLLIDEDKGPRDIVLNARDGRLQRVSEIHRSYDPLQYPLLFPFGNDGYCINIPQQNTAARSKTVSCMQFYAFRFMNSLSLMTSDLWGCRRKLDCRLSE
ncbi:unnamed protein product [Arctia plantaginis]|uniref:Helitron helicase-like domain-containing protein n=1 Tax=Arctia plantaginis TaxID=874455 RepID=A0A8S1AYH1_ARCPL|nr:unnamed protein product [Arctia plantaginis]